MHPNASQPHRRFAPIALAFVLFVAAVPALAQDDDDFSREGPYLGVYGIAAFENAGHTLPVDDTGGVGVQIGFRVVPKLAIEVMGDYLRLGGRNPWSLGTNVRLYVLPFFDVTLFDDRMQPFLIGTAGIQTGDLGDGKRPGGHVRGGLGADFWVTSDLAVSAVVQYAGSGGAASKLQTLNTTLGVLWRY